MTYIRRFSLLALLVALSISAASWPGRMGSAQEGGALAIAASGLTNPRGFTWGPAGELVVAEAGFGGDTAAGGEIEVPPPVGPYTGGLTARVVDASSGCPVTIADGLPSAISATGEAIGVSDVAFLDGTLHALVTGGGAAHGNPDAPNGIYRIGDGGESELVVDLGAWLLANPVASDPPPDFDPEGAFTAMVAVDDALWVVERNSEQVLRVTAGGEVTRIADLSADGLAPNAIAAAPGGGVYVGTLTSEPYPRGGASVLRIGEDGGVDPVWTGLTAVTGVAVGPDGTLFAAQLAETRDRPPFFQLSSGAVVRQTGEASAQPVVTGLNLPVALRFGPDGALYVSGPAIGASQGAGTILRIDPAAEDVAFDLSALSAPSCGGEGGSGDGTEGAGGVRDQPPPTAVSDGTGGSDAGGTGAGQGSGDGSTSEIVVRIYDYGFEPPQLTVPAGSTVIWANTGAVAHTVTGTLNGAPAWDSGELPPGGIFSFTFSDPGTYDYVCALHPEMTGTIVVE